MDKITFFKNTLKYFCIALILCAILCCARKESYENSDTKVDTLKLITISKIFSSNDSIFSLIRLNTKEIPFDKVYPKEVPEELSKYPLTYTIKPINDRPVEIRLDSSEKEFERNFWNRNLDSIILVNNEILSRFLSNKKISQDTFRSLILFLVENQYYSISKVIGKNYIEIRTKINEGYIYNLKDNEKPINTEAKEIKKLSKNLYSFREH